MPPPGRWPACPDHGFGKTPQPLTRVFGQTRLSLLSCRRTIRKDKTMAKHIADKRATTTGGRVKHFLRLSRQPRDTWHRPHAAAGSSRLVQFLRIARGHTA